MRPVCHIFRYQIAPRLSLFLWLFALVIPAGLSASESPVSIPSTLEFSLAFTANHGQWDSRALYQAKAPSATVWFTTDGVYYQFTRRGSTAVPASGASPQMPVNPKDCDSTIETMVLKVTFVGANSNPVVVAEGITDYHCNYFIGNDQSKWCTDVPNYSAIVYKNIYDGIDLKFFGNGRQLEYDFIIQPGADPSQIAVQYDGAEHLAVSPYGDLEITTKWGKVIEQAPFVYQVINGQRLPLPAVYVLKGESRFGFELLGGYQKELALVIDPVVLFSTYLGGSGAADYSFDVSVNSSNQVVVCGSTTSSDFPTVNAYDATISSTDIFVTKFNSSGTSLAFSTFIGGSGVDVASAVSVAVESKAGVVLTGYTASTNFPTASATDASANGGGDAFLVRLAPTGNSILFSTYLGGSAEDRGRELVVQCNTPCLPSSQNFNVWVCGRTYSNNLPAVNASQTTLSGTFDAFVARYANGFLGTTLSFLTYYGGTGGDEANAVTVSGSPVRVYIGGYTSSSDLPGLNGYDITYASSGDAFLTGLDIDGSGDVYPAISTYVGGSGQESIYALNSPLAGVVYVSGTTSSTGLGTLGAYDISHTTQSPGDINAFAAKFSNSGDALDAFTYFGTGYTNMGGDIAWDKYGNVFITGMTTGTVPLRDPWDSDRGTAPTFEAYVAGFSSTLSSLYFSTYLGGTDDERGYGLTANSDSCILATGETTSSNFPTVSPYDGSRSGTQDAYVTKICFPCCTGRTGNVDCDGGTDISDLSTLIDYLYITFAPLCCTGEANTDGQPGIDIADLSVLIDFLYINFTPPATCQ